MDGAGSDPGIEALRDGGVVASWENHGKTMGKRGNHEDYHCL